VVLADLEPTAAENAWRLARLVSNTPLRAATVHVAGTFEETPDGRRSGLDYEMAKDFARVLGLGLEVTVPHDLKTFFSRDGVIPKDVETDGSVIYTPDLLKTVDLYIGPFSVLPWRQRLMTIVPIYPMQNFLAGRKGEEIRGVNQLEGKRLAILKDSMQDNLLHALAASHGLTFNYRYVRPEDDLFAAVADGKADYTLDGALFFAQNRSKMKGLSLSPFPSDPVRVGWCLKKDDVALAGLVRKYLAKIQENGAFVRWFEAGFGTSFSDYLSLLATALGPAN
jgi:membrane-bound lytic murein transglycosylase MltF